MWFFRKIKVIECTHINFLKDVNSHKWCFNLMSKLFENDQSTGNFLQKWLESEYLKASFTRIQINFCGVN